MSNKALTEALAYAASCRDEALDMLRELGRIPAPSGHEEKRAEYVARWLAQQGATDVREDSAKNVSCLVGRCPMQEIGDERDLVIFSAHTDVVFPDTEELPLVEKDGRIFAPGIGDDTACLVTLLFAARWFLLRQPALDCNLLVVANSAEEGLGNLAGTKALFSRLAPRVREFVALDAHFPEVVTTAVGSVRYRISVTCQGGHSWKNYGRPNAIKELCDLIEALYALELPSGEGAITTRNVGTIEGGTTVNSIPAAASMLFEFRSTSEQCLVKADEQLRRLVDDRRRDDARFGIEVVGRRPAAGEVDAAAEADLIERCDSAMEAVLGKKSVHKASSTDANVPLSLGIPSATIGTVTGALPHTRDEWVEASSIEQGIAVALLLMMGHVIDESLQ